MSYPIGGKRVTALVLIGFVAFLAFLNRGGDNRATPPLPVTTLTESPTGTPTESGTAGPVGAPTGTPQDVAVKFVVAWMSRTADEPVTAWLDRMRPYTGPTLLAGLSTAAPDAVTAHRVTGAATVERVGQFGVQVIVPVDTGPKVLCGLSADGDRWTVTTITPVQPDPT